MLLDSSVHLVPRTPYTRNPQLNSTKCRNESEKENARTQNHAEKQIHFDGKEMIFYSLQIALSKRCVGAFRGNDNIEWLCCRGWSVARENGKVWANGKSWVCSNDAIAHKWKATIYLKNELNRESKCHLFVINFRVFTRWQSRVAALWLYALSSSYTS